MRTPSEACRELSCDLASSIHGAIEVTKPSVAVVAPSSAGLPPLPAVFPLRLPLPLPLVAVATPLCTRSTMLRLRCSSLGSAVTWLELGLELGLGLG